MLSMPPGKSPRSCRRSSWSWSQDGGLHAGAAHLGHVTARARVAASRPHESRLGAQAPGLARHQAVAEQHFVTFSGAMPARQRLPALMAAPLRSWPRGQQSRS